MPVTHKQFALSAIQAELRDNAEALERARSGALHEPPSTDCRDAYASQVRPGRTPLPLRVVCRVFGHLPYVCGSECCGYDLAWCKRCGAHADVHPLVAAELRKRVPPGANRVLELGL